MQHLYKNIVESSEDGFAIIAKNDKSSKDEYYIEFVNPAFATFLNCDSPLQLEGKSISQISVSFWKDHLPAILNELLNYNKNKVVISCENVSFEYSVLFNNKNCCIIQLKKRESYLKEEKCDELEKLKNNILSAFSSHEIVRNEEGAVVNFKCIEINTLFEVYSGLNRHDIINKYITEIPALRDEFIFEQLKEVAETGNSLKSIRYSIHLNKHIEISAYAVNSNTVATVISDSTSRIQAQRALLENEERFKLIFEAADDRIVLFDPYGGILFANKSFYSKLGYSKNNYPITNGEISKLTLDFEIENIRPKEEKITTNEYSIMHKNGKTLKMFATVKAVYGSTEGFFGILAVIRDVTEQRLIELELLNAKVRAEESDKLKTAFLANMSHEIRTPLNGIVGFSKLVARQGLDELKKEKYVKLIDQNAQQLMTIINDIIDTAKIESNQLELMFQNIEVAKLLLEINETYSKILENEEDKKITLKLSLPEHADLDKLYSDEFRIKQVLKNLLSNAVKFTLEGEIEFGYSYKNDFIQFYVKDTGIGISDEGKKIIFQRFTQEDGSSTRNFGGTGIGLSICKNLTEKMGGEIWFESTKGKGSCFYFTIPNIKDLSYSPIVKNGEKPKTVLVVDNFSSVYLNSFPYLSELGLKAFCCESQSETIRFLREHSHIDLIIVDVHLPEISVHDFVEKIRMQVDFEHVPIVAQISYSRHSEKEALLKLGFNGFYSKAIKREVFHSVIKSCLKIKTGEQSEIIR